MFLGVEKLLSFALAKRAASRPIPTVSTIGALTALPLFLTGAGDALALSQEQAIASCRESVGRPIVMACMQRSGGGGGNREANLARCKSGATPQVRACVVAALNKANGRANVAIEIAKPKEEVIAPGTSLPAGFVAPPRTIADITAILDSEKPDPATLAKLKEDADEEPDAKISKADLAEFYYDRANARALLARTTDAIADAEKGLALARSSSDLMLAYRIRQFLGFQKQALGDLKSSLKIFQDISAETISIPSLKAWVTNANRATMQILVATGDIAQTEGYLRRSIAVITEARTSGHPKWRASYQQKGKLWEADLEGSRAILFEARGQYREAEAAYKRSEDYKRSALPELKNIEYAPPESQLRHAADSDALSVARMKAKQGRLAEAEADARRALLARLKDQGKYNPQTTRFVVGLAQVMVEQGRYADAEKLIRTALEIQLTVGIPSESYYSAQIMSQLGAVLTLQRKPQDAAKVYAELDKAIAGWEPARKQVLELNGSRINALFASGQTEAGLAAAQELLKREISRVGEKHFDTAAARGTLATGYVRAGRDVDAIREFKAAIPILMAASRENADDDDDTVMAARSQRLQGIVESYIAVLAKANDNATGAVSLETFALADSIRGQNVQRALSASSARSVAKDPALADLVRREQDIGKQINAQLGSLNNALSSNARDEKVVKATGQSIDKLRSDRGKIRQEINNRFPNYAELIDPKPPSVEQIKATLADDEAMLSFYFGRLGSFVWAVSKNGPLTFASINTTSADIESKVRKLREALEPQAAMISDIPPFDLELGYELYSLLLKPVEAGWKSSKSLIVVTNGALGLLPLSLLPTAPTKAETSEELLFSSYRTVPWLARSHAVTMVPSSAALKTLRQLPPGKAGRGELIAFGDPLFSVEQADEAAKAEANPAPLRVADAGGVTTRGVPLKRRNSPKLEGVDSAELGLLPRLPDTADELRSIALALQADPSKVLNLGKAANEKAVKTIDLSGFKVLAFATHGLVPGELNGLTQPALALSAPVVAGVEGDGLLTMEEILSLKLDADWVVLSACNTGAGSGAGAEAASGLGRAFFYAGTKALLLTNWSVHSQSAKDLVTDLFKRQADDAKLTRSEALRLAMMALADSRGYLDPSGKPEFAYAHPLFWAPYSIIGDGGRR
jgi:CHAT domain-containing protein